MGIKRSEVILRMKKAIDAKESFNKFYSRMQKAGLGYRRQQMQGDWRSEGKIDKVEGAARYIRKGYLPTAATIAKVDYNLSQQFLIKMKVQIRDPETGKVKEQWGNIVSDRPLTPAEMEALLREERAKPMYGRLEPIVSITPWTIMQRV